MSRCRDAGIDSLAGLMIIYMIIFHIAGQYERTELFVTPAFESLSFFMFWFFYKGGLMHKDVPLIQQTRNSFRRLLIPYMFWTFIYFLIYESVLLLIEKEDLITKLPEISKAILYNGSCEYNLPLWFLISLFFVRNIFSIFGCKVNNNIFIFFLLITCFILTYFINQKLIDTSIYITNILLGLGCYSLGYSCRNIEFNPTLITIIATIYLIILLFFPSSLDFRTNQLITGSYIPMLCLSVSGCVLFSRLFSLKYLNIPFLSVIGRHSMQWYILHWPVKYLCGIALSHTILSDFAIKTFIIILLTGISVIIIEFITTRLSLQKVWGQQVSSNQSSLSFNNS